jgi:hypothetical protein
MEDFSYEFEFLQVHDTSLVFLLKIDEMIASLEDYSDMQQLEIWLLKNSDKLARADSVRLFDDI